MGCVHLHYSKGPAGSVRDQSQVATRDVSATCCKKTRDREGGCWCLAKSKETGGVGREGSEGGIASQLHCRLQDLVTTWTHRQVKP